MSNSVPWDGSGTDVSECTTIAEACEQGGINFDVEIRQGYFNGPVPSEPEPVPEPVPDFIEAEGFYYVVRTDTNEALGQCKSKFTPLQNSEAVDFIEPLIQERLCHIDTIGSINRGEKVWIMCKLEEQLFVLPNEEISLYLLLINAHDSSTRLTIGVVPMRINCANMFSMISKSDVTKFKHMGDTRKKLEQVRSKIFKQVEDAKDLVEKLKHMTGHWPDATELDDYFREVFKIKEGAATKSENKIKRLKELFITGRGNQDPQIRGSWYAAYNSVSEYLNFEYGRSANNRLMSLWTGANRELNNKALSLAYEKAK